MTDVCVIMTTYNGEKYLKEQIDSILSQINVNVTLFIRDDQSTDDTKAILKKYEADNCLKIYEDELHLGAANGFMELLYHSPEASYYAFADQDDVWMPEKLDRAVKMIGESEIPVLYCSNQMIYKNRKVTGLRFENEPNCSLVNSICGNSIAGCTMVFNRALRDILVKPENRPSKEILKIRMHDVWVLLCAHATGNVIYDSNAYIKYRIHENNTVGIKHAGLSHKFKKLVRIVKNQDIRHGRSRIAGELLNVPFAREKDRQVVKKFAEYQDSITNKVRLLKDPIVKKDCNELRGVFFLKTIFNIL